MFFRKHQRVCTAFSRFYPTSTGCENTPMTFAAAGSSGATSITWDFGDANSGAANTSGLSFVAHQFSDNGVYNADPLRQT
ncbi:MAG: PKD domain-containing protein [Saprospiraceae bacterium]